MKKHLPYLSIIILNWNTKDLLLDCLQSIFQHTKKVKFEVIVCDNDSSDGSLEAVRKKYKKVKTIQNGGNVGFSKGNNPGMKMAKGRYLLLLNTDTKVDHDVFSQMVKWMDQNKQAGILGPKLLNADSSLQPSAGNLPNLWGIFAQLGFPIHLFAQIIPYLRNIPILKIPYKSYYKNPRITGWVSGSCFLIRRQVYAQIGGLDENIFMYVEETEYCKRATDAGWQVWINPDFHLFHLERGSSTSGKKGSVLGIYKGLYYYFRKHHSVWQLYLLAIILKIGAIIRLPLNVDTYSSALKISPYCSPSD
jgi:GT2 family glycosyltransferase